MIDDEIKARMAELIQEARATKQKQQDDVDARIRQRDEELRTNVSRARELQVEIPERFTEFVAASDRTLAFQAGKPADSGRIAYRIKWEGPTTTSPDFDRELVVWLNTTDGTLAMGWSINGVDGRNDEPIPASTFDIRRIDRCILSLMDNGAWKHSHPKL